MGRVPNGPAEAWILPVLMCTASTQKPTQPTESGPLNAAISCGENILGVDPIEDRAIRPPKIVLSEEQANILDKVKKGGNVFFTGPAGTGKTVLLGGTTLHSWAGIGLGEGIAEHLSGKILGTDYLRERWQGVESLIIDEISMINGVLFDKLEEIARTVRHDQKPFGGIQVKLKPS
ncbi:hypothetical protein H4582DRAFT_873729 [Lactarius indigo]|nr:hypothetical protein H4582DRAFT_873729 [Lactarius indigo]